MQDVDNYDKTLALQENYAELIIDIHISYVSSTLIVQAIIIFMRDFSSFDTMLLHLKLQTVQ